MDLRDMARRVGVAAGFLVLGIVIGLFAGRMLGDKPLSQSSSSADIPSDGASVVVSQPGPEQSLGTLDSSGGAVGTTTTTTVPASQDTAKLLARTRELLTNKGYWNEEAVVGFCNVLDTAKPQDYPKLLVLLHEREWGWLSCDLRSVLMHRWARRDLQGALAAAQALPHRVRSDTVSAVVEAWSVMDSKAALAWVLAEAIGTEREDLVEEVAYALARIDPPGAYRVLLENGINPGSAYSLDSILIGWAASDPVAALEAALELPNTRDFLSGNSYLYGGIFGKWVEKDADAAIRWVESMDGGKLRVEVQRALSTAMVKVDPRRAIAMAEKEQSRSAREGMLGSIFQEWMSMDFVAAKNWLGAVEDEHLYSGLLQRVADMWILEDVAEFAEIVGELPPGGDRRGMLSRLGSEWPVRDMDAFLKWFGTVSSESEQESLLKAAVDSLSSSDPTKAVAFYDALPNGAKKYSLAGDLLETWIPRDPDAALKWFDTLPAVTRRAMQRMDVASALAKVDPERGLAFAMDFGSGWGRGYVVGEVVGSWADRDMEAAVKWVWDEAEDEDFVSAASAVIQKLVPEDPLRAAVLALTLPEDKRDQVDASLAYRWADIDYRTMLEWATAQTDREIGPYVSAGIAKWAEEDPAAAATALSVMPESNGTNAATQSVVSQWSHTDPTSAAEWVLSFPEGDLRDISVSTLVGYWTGRNEEQAEAFVSELRDPHTRDTAALAFIESIREYDREKATTWLETIADEDIRKQADRYLK